MSYKEAFKKRGLLKIFLIALSIVVWMYFYTSSNISLKALVIFDLPTLVNSFLTLDFLFLLIFFPITSAICIALSAGREKIVDLTEVFSGIFLGFLLSFLFFKFSSNFLIFTIFYLASHIILSLLTYNKFKERDNIFTLSNYANSKISLLLTLSIFLAIFLVLLPHQNSYSEKMQAGIVNIFVGEELGDWLGTSYSIGKASTVSAVDFITDSDEYKALKNIQNQEVYKYIDYMEDLKEDLSKKTTSQDIEKIYANLDTVEVKNQVLNAISSIPLMVVITQFFALFFAIIMASVMQIYFSIAFSLVGLLYVYLFFRLFYNVKKEEEEV
jgi:flagellar biosynthesis protein FlhB